MFKYHRDENGGDVNRHNGQLKDESPKNHGPWLIISFSRLQR